MITLLLSILTGVLGYISSEIIKKKFPWGNKSKDIKYKDGDVLIVQDKDDNPYVYSGFAKKGVLYTFFDNEKKVVFSRAEGLQYVTILRNTGYNVFEEHK
jgi:hypothetical protein